MESNLEPLELSRKTFIRSVVVVWACVLALQAAVFFLSEISVRDACGWYMPLAREAAAGRWDSAQCAFIPPLYPIAVGLLSRVLGWARDPVELAGKLLNMALFQVILACVLAVARSLWSRRVALAALGLAGFNMKLLPMSANVWLEPSLTTALTLSFTVLVLTRDRLRWWAVVLLGVLGGLAPLVRSEGILLPLLLAGGLAVIHFRRPGVGLLKLAGGCAAILVLGAAFVAPRVKYVYDRTGYAVHDIRVAAMSGKGSTIPRKYWLLPLNVVDAGPTLNAITGDDWEYHPNLHDEPGAWALASLAGLAEGWNPAVILLLIYGLFRRSPLPRHGRCEAVIALLAVPLLIVYGRTLFLHARMTTVFSPMMSILGAVGLVALAEHVRRRFASAPPAWWHAWSASLRLQLAMLALILAGCVPFCLLNAQRRGAWKRYTGEYILSAYGEGRKILSKTDEPAYYAHGWLLGAPVHKGKTCSLDTLLAALRESHADLLVVSEEDDWCPELNERILHKDCDSARIALPEGKKYRGGILLDAPRLVEALSSPPTGAKGP
jgi:hypothetical protein